MRIALLPFVTSLAVWGAEIVLPAPPFLYSDGASVQLAHGDASVCVNTPAGVSTNIGFAFDTNAHWQTTQTLRYRTGISGGSQTGTLCMPIKGLAPGTLYRACPVMADVNGNSTNCTNTGTDPNRFVTFTTLEIPPIEPVPPTRPVITFDTTYPAGVPAIGAAGDFRVGANCSNPSLQTQYNAARAAADGDGLPRAVTIPNNVNCSGAPALTLTSAVTTAWVIIRTDQEPNLPLPKIRVSNAVYGSLMPTITTTVTNNTSVVFIARPYVRFVGLRFLFNDSTAIPQAGTPTYSLSNLIKIAAHVDHVIFDRCVFDGQGYPARIQAAFAIECDLSPAACNQNNLAWIESDFDNIYNWVPWMGLMTVTGGGSHTLSSSTSFQVGRGDQVCTVAPFSIRTNDTSSVNWRDYLDASCGHIIKYSSGAAPTCTGVTCVSDASLAVPATGLRLDAYPTQSVPMATSAGLWPAAPIFWWGSSGYGPGVMPPAGGEQNSFAIDVEDGGGTPADNIDNWIFQNNRVNGSGIMFFIEAKGVAKNILVTRNTFSNPSNCVMPGPPGVNSPPYSCFNRYPFELKNGFQWDFTGNTILSDFKSIGTDGSWFSLKPDYTALAGSYVGDGYIANNYVTQAVGCFYISGELNNGNGIWNFPKPIRRVSYTNNFCQSDSWANTSFWGKYGPGVANNGYSVIDQGAVDINISHNTWYDTRGPGPGLFAAEAFSHALRIAGNLLTYHQSTGVFKGFQSGYYGTGRWSARTLPDMGFTGLIEGTAGLNVASPSLADVQGISWTWDNLVVPGCVNSSPATCTSLTSGSGLVTAPTSLYPASTQWPAGATLAARFTAAGLIDPANGNFRQLYSSIYNSGGSRHALDGLAYGFDQDANEQARGVILTPHALMITATTASVAVTVPDAGMPCSVAYSTTGGPPWTVTAADTTNSRQRSIPVSGLSPLTLYSYQVWCAGTAPSQTYSFQSIQ